MNQEKLNKAFVPVIFTFCLLFGMALSSQAFASESAEKKDNNAPLYVDFKNIVVPVIKKNGQTGVVALSLMVQVRNEKDQSSVVNNMPRLRDAFIRTLYGNLDTSQLMLENGALDIPQIKVQLMKTADIVMRDGKKDRVIKDLLFQNIAQQAY
jgi:flagellar basal body-associated protein FliL